MMRKIILDKPFKKEYQQIIKIYHLKDEFVKVVTLLALGEKLPLSYKDHQLCGNYKSYRECHLKPNVILLYKIEDDKLIVVLCDIGSHASVLKI